MGVIFKIVTLLIAIGFLSSCAEDDSFEGKMKSKDLVYIVKNYPKDLCKIGEMKSFLSAVELLDADSLLVGTTDNSSTCETFSKTEGLTCTIDTFAEDLSDKACVIGANVKLFSYEAMKNKSLVNSLRKSIINSPKHLVDN